MLAPERKHRGSGVWSRKEIENFLLAPKAIRRVLAARIKDKEVAVHPDRRLRGLVLLIVQEALARRYDGRPVAGGNWHVCHRLGLSRSRFLVPAGPVGHQVFRLFPIGEKGRSAAELSGKSSRGEDQTGAALPALFALLEFSCTEVLGAARFALRPVSSIEVEHARIIDSLPAIARWKVCVGVSY